MLRDATWHKPTRTVAQPPQIPNGVGHQLRIRAGNGNVPVLEAEGLSAVVAQHNGFGKCNPIV
jgi:hypothetical protein